LIDFGRRSIDNLSKIAVYIARQLDEVPAIKKAVLAIVTPLLCK